MLPFLQVEIGRFVVAKENTVNSKPFRLIHSPSVLVVGEESAWISLLIHFLEAEVGCEVRHRARAADDAKEALRQLPGLMVIMEGAVPDGTTIELLRARRAQAPECRVLVVSLPGPIFARAAKAAGADGFVSNAAPLPELVTALHEVLAGRNHFDAEFEHRSEDAETLPARPLTLRECEILRMVGEGWASKQIASAFGLSVRTVENHRASIMRKTGLRSAAQLAVRAVELGLVRGTVRGDLVAPSSRLRSASYLEAAS